MGIAALRTRGMPGRLGRLFLGAAATGEAGGLSRAHGVRLRHPADTGVVYGLLSPLLMIATSRGLNFECRPMFEDSGLRGAVSATVHVRPLSVAGALCTRLSSRLRFIRAAGAAWRARK